MFWQRVLIVMGTFLFAYLLSLACIFWYITKENHIKWSGEEMK